MNFVRGQKKIHIEDAIPIDADKNPKNLYKKLDSDDRKVSEKYNGIYLYPTCYGGLLSVEYSIKMKIAIIPILMKSLTIIKIPKILIQ